MYSLFNVRSIKNNKITLTKLKKLTKSKKYDKIKPTHQRQDGLKVQKQV